MLLLCGFRSCYSIVSKKKRVMVMKVNNKAETDREDEHEKIPPLKDADDV